MSLKGIRGGNWRDWGAANRLAFALTIMSDLEKRDVSTCKRRECKEGIRGVGRSVNGEAERMVSDYCRTRVMGLRRVTVWRSQVEKVRRVREPAWWAAASGTGTK